MTTRKDKMENHPPHSKSAAPSLPAWSNKGNPFLHRWAPFIAVKDLSGPLFGGIQLTNSGKQTQTKEKEKKKHTQHMQPFGSLDPLFSCPISNPPFHEGILASCTYQPHQCGPLKPLASSFHASFSKVILLWLQLALRQAAMTQGYTWEALPLGHWDVSRIHPSFNN